MTTTDTPHNQFPVPYRAPGSREQIARYPEKSDLDWTGDRDDRRYLRAIDGWMAGRIRKATRHWRSR